ncbi:MAG: Xaa-Pro peptidase family protein [Synergistaceae bacterium]|jgi:Xaa-Pro aminopeptidase|nr:Xaa-Pro peptidase family protein [Synergistaceae bacterium]
MDDRMKKLAALLEEAALDALILKKMENQRYIEGFTGGDCYMVASGGGNFLVADSRYTEIGSRECRTAEVRPHRHPHPPFGEVIAMIAKERGFSRVGFEREFLTWGEHEDIERALCGAGAELVPTSSLVERIRAVKDDCEIASTRAACKIADDALRETLPVIKQGVSELDVKTELDYKLMKLGADGPSFDNMVLFGARTSQPHANSRRDAILKKGDFILIDYGAMKDGYRSDTTRTFVFGAASPEQRRAYAAVSRAQAESQAMVAEGADGREINERALSIIKGAGLPGFEYGIGHGVGLEIHEEPFMRQKKSAILQKGNIVTVEPGTYRPGWGGIRIEDTVAVSRGGNEALTLFPKELIEL